MNKKVIYEVWIAGYKLQLIQAFGDFGRAVCFSVVYGSQVKNGLSYGGAAHEFGECLMHALGCAGKIDA